jgi:Helix-turn-helix.
MDLSQFVDRMNELMFDSSRPTYLQTLRKRRGYSQSQLAKFSGIPLRTIQQYEQRRKDINMAAAHSLYNLSKVLCCRIEDLLENTAPLV